MLSMDTTEKAKIANWHEEVLDRIDTPDKLALAQIACNDFAAANVPPAEIKETH